MKTLFSAIWTGLLVTASFAAIASTPLGTRLDLKNAFDVQRGAILAALADGETYAEIKTEDRRKVGVALDRIAEVLAGRPSAASLSEAEKVAVFNEQEVVNTILTRARADSRMVCTREKTVGSHRTTNVCYTVAERRRMREQTQNALIDNRRVQLPASN